MISKVIKTYFANHLSSVSEGNLVKMGKWGHFRRFVKENDDQFIDHATFVTLAIEINSSEKIKIVSLEAI